MYEYVLQCIEARFFSVHLVILLIQKRFKTVPLAFVPTIRSHLRNSTCPTKLINEQLVNLTFAVDDEYVLQIIYGQATDFVLYAGKVYLSSTIKKTMLHRPEINSCKIFNG
jgi:hypothetical protein